MVARVPRRDRLGWEAVRARESGDLEAARRTFEALWAEFPRENHERVDLGLLLQDTGQIERAIQMVQEWLRLDPKDDVLWNNLISFEAPAIQPGV